MEDSQDLFRSLISKNQLLDAIKLLHGKAKGIKQKNMLALLQSRLHDVNDKIRRGTLSTEEANLELNKIRDALLSFHSTKTESTLTGGLLEGRNLVIIGFVLVLTIAVPLLWINFSGAKEEAQKCLDSKLAILVADFQDAAHENDRDGFANSIVNHIDSELDDKVYDVSPVGAQTRKIRRYDDFIRQQHFESTCDTSGLFINGLLDMQEKVFNVYITIANLVMDVPELSKNRSIILDNPSGMEFSIPNDAEFLANFVLAVLLSYEGQPYKALDELFELEKDEKGRTIIEEDENMKANIAFFKGNCYAMRGDNTRANDQYAIVNKEGNAELVAVANNNRQIADDINKEMKSDPTLNAQLAKNESEHSEFERDLQILLKGIDSAAKDLGRGIEKLFKKKR